MSAFDPTDAPNRTHFWARLVVDELTRLGVRHAVVGPGSRSTPLTTAAAHHPDLEAHVHVDERGGAYFALGCARADGVPAAWITTSGTAAANGLPAVMEAARDHVPLVLLTADRPPELRETGSNQTVDQVGLFGSRVRAAFDCPVPDPAIDPAAVLTTVDQLVHRARGLQPGPVHLNCMYRKPLEPRSDPAFDGSAELADHDSLTRWLEAEGPYTRYGFGGPRLAEEDLEDLGDALGRPRGLLIAGRLPPCSEPDAVSGLADRLGWPLLPDVSSRLRLGLRHAGTVPYHDLLLAAGFAPEPGPEVVLQVGDRPVSKPLRAYLREADPPTRIVLAPHADRIDPDHRVTHRLSGSASQLANCLGPADRERAPDSAWTERWRQADRLADRVLEDRLGDADELTEPGLARVLSEEIGAEHGLFLANSRPVRDLHTFGASGKAPALTVTNRGASGIDGNVSTAAGYAAAAGHPVTALIGDLALLHDLNGLALCRDLEVPVVLVVVNNDGGGIFHFLPIAEHPDVFEPYFTAPHGLRFENAAAQFDLSYAAPTSLAAFRRTYRDWREESVTGLIEIATDRRANRAHHEALTEALAKALRDPPGR